MIESPDNEKLKLVRKLRERRHRDREGLFVTEGEDLAEAGLRAGATPRFILVAAGSRLDGQEVDPDLLDDVSALGSGTRVIGVWPQRYSEPDGPVCLYLHAIGDPGNVGTIIRTADALVDGSVVLGPECADPYSPKAARATMGSVFSKPLARGGIEDTPEPRVALSAHGGDELAGLAGVGTPLTLCLGAERVGLPPDVLSRCEHQVTVPLRPGGAESLNVAAVAAIACERISSLAREPAGPRSDTP